VLYRARRRAGQASLDVVYIQLGALVLDCHRERASDPLCRPAEYRSPPGRLKGCTCIFGQDCIHTWTRLDPRYPRARYQMDYVFASPALAERLVHCEALSPSEWSRFSDHSPIVATFG
jgi:endonuclease/exonuclease/phosphatase family metal-dependent hydrolase